MLPSDKNVDMLADFGLTRNQAKVYIAAVQLGLASVGQISKLSKVRREDVYRLLPNLEKMGLVEKLLGMPTKIRATPIEDALSILIKREQDVAEGKVADLKVKKEALLKHFKTSNQKPKLEDERANFALLSQRDAIMSQLLNMMKDAKNEIDLVCSRTKLMQFIHNFAEQLKKITKRNVKIRIVSEVPEYEDSIPRIIEEHVSPGNSIELRYTDMPSSHYFIVDLNQALIATTTEGNMADNPCLWTNNSSLVGLLLRNFEDLWHDSINWKRIEIGAVPEKLTRFVEQLRPTSHVIFLYNSPEAKYNVLFNYLKAGLENGEAAVYVAGDEDPHQIRKAMKQFGISVEKCEKEGSLQIIEYKEIYIIDGKFDLNTTIGLWNKLYDEALKRGFKGLRVTGEMACFFKHNLIKELIDYERALHRILDIPMIAICAYNASSFNKRNDPINVYTELVRAHGTVLFTGIDHKLGKMEIRKAQPLQST